MNDSHRTGALAGAMYKVIATDQSWQGSNSDLALLLSRRFGLPMDEVRAALQRDGKLQVATQVSEQDAELLRNVLARIGVTAQLEAIYPVSLDASDTPQAGGPNQDVTMLDVRGQSQAEMERSRPDDSPHTMLQWSRRSNSENDRGAHQAPAPGPSHTPQRIRPITLEGLTPPESLDTVLNVSVTDQDHQEERPTRSFSEEIADIWGGVISQAPIRESGEQLVRAPRSADTVISDSALPALAPDAAPDAAQASGEDEGWGAVLNHKSTPQAQTDTAERSSSTSPTQDLSDITSQQLDVTNQYTAPETGPEVIDVVQSDESDAIDITTLQFPPEDRPSTPDAAADTSGVALKEDTQATLGHADPNPENSDRETPHPFKMPRLAPLPDAMAHGARATPASLTPPPRLTDRGSAPHLHAAQSQHPSHDPRLAALLSALIPGAGQIYNGQWNKAWFYGLTCWLIVPWILGVRDAWRTGQDVANGMLSPENVGEVKRVALYGVIWAPIFALLVVNLVRAGAGLMPEDAGPTEEQTKTAVITARGEALLFFERALYRADKAQTQAGEASAKKDEGQDGRTSQERKRSALKELSKARAACAKRQYIQCRHFAQRVVDAQTASKLTGEAIKLMTEANKGLRGSTDQDQGAADPNLFAPKRGDGSKPPSPRTP